MTRSPETQALSERRRELRRELNGCDEMIRDLRAEGLDEDDPALKGYKARADELHDQIETLDMQQRAAAGRSDRNGAAYMTGMNGLLGPHGEDLASPDDLKQIARTSRPAHDNAVARVSAEHAMKWLAESNGPGGVVPITPAMEAGISSQVLPLPQPPPRLRTVLASRVISERVVTFTVRVPAESDGPAPVVPGSLKPVVTFSYEDVSVSTTTVAGHAKVLVNDMDDVPVLLPTLNRDLPADVADVLEGLLVDGDGSVSDAGDDVPGLTGILRTSGIGSVGAEPAERVDAILDARAAVAQAGGTPNLLIAGPAVINDLLKTKDTTGRYLFDPSSTALRVWDLTPVSVAKMPEGRMVVADSRGATVLLRSAITVFVGTESDDLIRNRRTFLAEGRFGLAVERPMWFCEIEVSESQSPGTDAEE